MQVLKPDEWKHFSSQDDDGVERNLASPKSVQSIVIHFTDGADVDRPPTETFSPHVEVFLGKILNPGLLQRLIGNVGKALYVNAGHLTFSIVVDM